MSIASQPLTAEELWQIPNDGIRRELIRGQVSVMPPSGGEHSVVGLNLAAPLWSHVRQGNLGVVLSAEAGFILARDPDTVRAADIAFVRRDRIPASGVPKAFWPGPPDLAVEVVSPGDTLQEVEDKVFQWLEAGTAMVWVVSPRRRTVTVYRSANAATILRGDDLLDGQDVVPGFQYRVDDVFA